MNPSSVRTTPSRLIQFALAMIIAILLGACGGGSGQVGLPSGVALFVSAPSGLTLAAPATASYAVGGGTPNYTASSSNKDVATVVVNGANITITAIAAGTASIAVTDAVGASVQLPLTVTGGSAAVPATLFTSAGTAVSVAAGAKASYTIGGGSGAYSATSSNASIATASITGTTLNVTALLPGTATIRVLDALGNAVSIDVTVQQQALAVFPQEASGNVGDNLAFVVNGGTPPYAITMNNANIATAAPASIGSSGGAFDVRLANVGETSAVIIDASGRSLTVPVKVNQVTTTLRLSPGSLTVAENHLGAVALNIYGGTPPYRAFTSDETLSFVSVSGTVLTIGVGTRGNRCITPLDSAGIYIPFGTFDVTVTTIDSLGASATSVLTLKDNGIGAGAGCP